MPETSSDGVISKGFASPLFSPRSQPAFPRRNRCNRCDRRRPAFCDFFIRDWIVGFA